MSVEDQNQQAVREFHQAFGLTVNAHPTIDVTDDVRNLRIDLLNEEASETITAALDGDLVELADGLADVLYYIAYGTAITYGIDLGAVFREVHRSNMSKLGADGKPIHRADGKVMKGPRYSPPDIAGVLGDQADPERPMCGHCDGYQEVPCTCPGDQR